MKDKRPVNLDLGTIRLPLAAYTSILHRISGVIVFIGIAILLWLFDLSLGSEDGFNTIRQTLDSFMARLVLWGILSALAYHLVAGIRHLLMDMGIADGKASGTNSARLVVVVGILLILVLGGWLWPAV
ncbi:MAG: succinate dehydrogenase, cytochrome b556 subunit [Pseudomonadales bacterium]|nr:succinate dehydrogenase, cytochrome b556 subunit [Pseudomonadales bacterium]